MNTITIHGNLGKDPVLDFTPSKMAVAEFSICVTYGKDDKQTKTWFNIKAFGQLAENVCNTLTKGDTCIIVGRMETREYKKSDGTDSKFTTVIADEIGASCRWGAWVKDQSAKTVAKAGKIGRPMPAVQDDPF